MQKADNDESKFAQYLYEKHYLSGPLKCKWGCKNFLI